MKTFFELNGKKRLMETLRRYCRRVLNKKSHTSTQIFDIRQQTQQFYGRNNKKSFAKTQSFFGF